MSFFDKIKQGFNNGRDELTKQVGRIKNKNFMQATVAVCVRISMADGNASSEEKQKMMGFLRTSEELKVFDIKEVIDFYNKLISNFDFDAEVGKGEAMKYVLALKDKPQEAQLALRVGIAVGKSDGDFDANEQKVLQEMVSALGLSPADFDV